MDGARTVSGCRDRLNDVGGILMGFVVLAAIMGIVAFFVLVSP